jgi:hypothetical protein
VVIGIFSLTFMQANKSDTERMEKLEASGVTPQEFATLTVYEPKAEVKTQLQGHDLTITYNLPLVTRSGCARK